MATSPQGSGLASPRGGQFQNLSKFFAGHQTTLKAGSRTLEKERSGVGQFRKKPGVDPSCRANSGASAPERARQEISKPKFMTNAQLKNLVTEAVSLHREITEQNERLKTLKADLIREARLHEKEFTTTDNGGSRWTAAGTDGCIARVNFPAPAIMSLIDSESETFDHVIRPCWRMHRSSLRVRLFSASGCRFSRRSLRSSAEARCPAADRALPDQMLTASQLRDRRN
jgi:hypothetical protein